MRKSHAILALLLCTCTSNVGAAGYLTPSEQIDISRWLPQPPAAGSVDEATDVISYLGLRSTIGQPRGDEAQADDVFDPPAVALRFADALGVKLDPANAKHFLDMMKRISDDQKPLLATYKKPVAEGGRVRPYVRYPALPSCPHDVDDHDFGLAKSGSYPSGHATLGWIWALILTEAAPDRADALIAKGYSFGESRQICGFHFESDLQAGRLVASTLLAKLHANSDFEKDLHRAIAEIRLARKAAAR